MSCLRLTRSRRLGRCVGSRRVWRGRLGRCVGSHRLCRRIRSHRRGRWLRCRGWFRSRSRLWRHRWRFRRRRLRGGRSLRSVPVHKVSSNYESEHNAAQDDREECPAAALVIVCHEIFSLSGGQCGPDSPKLASNPPTVECGDCKFRLPASYSPRVNSRRIEPRQPVLFAEASLEGGEKRSKIGENPMETTKLSKTE